MKYHIEFFILMEKELYRRISNRKQFNLRQLESIIAKIELSKPTGQLQSITDIPNNTGNSFNIFRKLRFQRIKFKQKLFKILFYKLLLGYKPSSESHIACFYVERNYNISPNSIICSTYKI
mgnify:CR=1 FL=1